MADTAQRTSYYYTTVPDKPGEGANVLEILKRAGVNLRAVHAFPVGQGRSQLDFFPEDAAAFERAAREGGIKLSAKKEALLVEGPDRVGAGFELLDRLGAVGINVTAIDALRVGGRFGSIVWVRPQDLDKAAKALGAK